MDLINDISLLVERFRFTPLDLEVRCLVLHHVDDINGSHYSRSSPHNLAVHESLIHDTEDVANLALDVPANADPHFIRQKSVNEFLTLSSKSGDTISWLIDGL